jgi:hypothetical protein
MAMHQDAGIRYGLPSERLLTPPIRNSVSVRSLMTVNHSQTMKAITKNVKAQTLIVVLRLDKTYWQILLA